MKWKNGHGTSAEIAIYPRDAAFAVDPFLWRLSSAHMSEGSSFSLFPGYQRHLALVKGEGLRLKIDQNIEDVLLLKGQFCEFSGEQEVASELVTGPVSDLNLIVKRDHVQARFDVMRFSKKPRSIQIEGKCAFIFGISGKVKASVYPGEHQFQIDEGETLQIQENPGSEERQLALLEPASPDCALCLVELDWI